MNLLTIGTLAYLGIGTLAALYFIAVRYVKFDQFDARFCRRDALAVIVQSVFLWPLFLIAPRNPFLNPYRCLRGYGASKADAERKFHAFLKNPPPSGRLIRIRPTHRLTGDSQGLFTFPSASLLSAAESRLARRPSLDDEIRPCEYLHAWLSASRCPKSGIADAPDDMRAIPGVVGDLLRAGEAGLFARSAGLNTVQMS